MCMTFIAIAMATVCMAHSKDAAKAGQANGDNYVGDVITLNVYYTGPKGNAKKFVKEVERIGTADSVRNEAGNIRYDYFLSRKNPDEVLLVEKWKGQKAVESHNATPMMKTIGKLKKKYGLTTVVERYVKKQQ